MCTTPSDTCNVCVFVSLTPTTTTTLRSVGWCLAREMSSYSWRYLCAARTHFRAGSKQITTTTAVNLTSPHSIACRELDIPMHFRRSVTSTAHGDDGNVRVLWWSLSCLRSNACAYMYILYKWFALMHWRNEAHNETLITLFPFGPEHVHHRRVVAWAVRLGLQIDGSLCAAAAARIYAQLCLVLHC